jgi:hypothetical protein
MEASPAYKAIGKVESVRDGGFGVIVTDRLPCSDVVRLSPPDKSHYIPCLPRGSLWQNRLLA